MIKYKHKLLKYLPLCLLGTVDHLRLLFYIVMITIYGRNISKELSVVMHTVKHNYITSIIAIT